VRLSQVCGAGFRWAKNCPYEGSCLSSKTLLFATSLHPGFIFFSLDYLLTSLGCKKGRLTPTPVGYGCLVLCARNYQHACGGLHSNCTRCARAGAFLVLNHTLVTPAYCNTPLCSHKRGCVSIWRRATLCPGSRLNLPFAVAICTTGVGVGNAPLAAAEVSSKQQLCVTGSYAARKPTVFPGTQCWV